MNKELNIWGRDFTLEVIFDAFSDEEVLTEQLEALRVFMDKANELLSDSQDIERYCIENSNGLLVAPVNNLFKYVIPTSIYVKRDTEVRTVAILCNFRFDDEHGCALVFENEELTRICTQDEL